MKQTLTFIPPVVDSTQSSIHTEAYEKSVDLYNQGEYLQAFHSLLDYLNADFRTKYGNTDGTEFHIPHGSILVHISVKDGFYRISADFLNLPEKGRVAMLRQIADLNLNKLLLPRFVKDNDKLRMGTRVLSRRAIPIRCTSCYRISATSVINMMTSFVRSSVLRGAMSRRSPLIHRKR